MLATASLGAQSSEAFPFSIHFGVPQGEFAENVDAAIGIGGGALGFSAFTTTSSVEGSNSSNEPFASPRTSTGTSSSRRGSRAPTSSRS